MKKLTNLIKQNYYLVNIKSIVTFINKTIDISNVWCNK